MAFELSAGMKFSHKATDDYPPLPYLGIICTQKTHKGLQKICKLCTLCLLFCDFYSKSGEATIPFTVYIPLQGWFYEFQDFFLWWVDSLNLTAFFAIAKGNFNALCFKSVSNGQFG